MEQQQQHCSATAGGIPTKPHHQLAALGQAVDQAGRRGAAHAVQCEAGLGEELGSVQLSLRSLPRWRVKLIIACMLTYASAWRRTWLGPAQPVGHG